MASKTQAGSKSQMGSKVSSRINTGKSADTSHDNKENGRARDAIAMLKQDHREVEDLFAQHEDAGSQARKDKLFAQIAEALKIHTVLEEEIFYPALRSAADAEDDLDEAQVEHDTVKMLIADCEADGAAAPFYDAKVKVLSEYVAHHVKEEEQRGGLFSQARKADLDLNELGQRMAERKQELQGAPDMIEARPVALHAFAAASNGQQPSRASAAR